MSQDETGDGFVTAKIHILITSRHSAIIQRKEARQMDIKINIDCTHYVPLLASPADVVLQVNSVRIADAPTMGGAFGTDAEFTRSGPLLWSPPV